MVPVICFTGYSGSGKTTYLEKLIPVLVSKGLKIGVIKHDIHGIDIDKPGSDTMRLRNAGAEQVAINGPDYFFYAKKITEKFNLLEFIFMYFSHVDLVLVEGYKQSDLPKVEVFRSDSNIPSLPQDIQNIIATVSDKNFRRDIPNFNLNRAVEFADWLIENFIDHTTKIPDKIKLLVNGKVVPLKPFIDTMFFESLKGMLKALKDCENAEEVQISFRI